MAEPPDATADHQTHCGHWHRRDEDTGAWIDQCCRCNATWAAWDGVPDEACPAAANERLLQ